MRDIWKNLPFHGFSFEGPILENRKEEWFNAAEKILTDLEHGEKPTLVMPTSGGKTIIAFLAALAMKERVLFLVPTKILANEHKKSWKDVTGRADNALVMIGGNREGNWNAEGVKIIFATPHKFLADKEALLSGFSLVVLDESHHARKKYPYVEIAEAAFRTGVPTLSLTASPGDNEKEIEEMKSACHSTRFVPIRLKTPEILVDRVIVQMDDTLKEMDNLFQKMLMESALRLRTQGIPFPINRILTRKELKTIENRLEAEFQHNKRFGRARSEIAQYGMVRHCQCTALTESYHAFLAHVDNISKSTLQAAKRVMRDETFMRICRIATEAKQHPKVEMLMHIAGSLRRMNKKMFAFVGIKENGRYLCQTMCDRGVKTDVLFGSKDRNLKKQDETVLHLRQGEIEAVVSTIWEGLSVSEVSASIHYSMPMKGISRIQRDGRTGRVRPGNVIFITLAHSLDEGIYYATLAKVAKMYRIVWEEQQKPKRKKGWKKPNPAQLDLYA
ncbi:DEAD/DEAH box helicase family protein [Candidatus Azambacteria bacterium]|nr:DEAD/DEAH box helicase family protein [Candidatus Azambacteria bacterium]MBI3685466.1 DEAD/DEAH box helicase family protein [Candidatus Azambacteria bacterium]